MNDELLALYTADREERIDQPRMGTPDNAIHLTTRAKRVEETARLAQENVRANQWRRPA